MTCYLVGGLLTSIVAVVIAPRIELFLMIQRSTPFEHAKIDALARYYAAAVDLEPMRLRSLELYGCAMRPTRSGRLIISPSFVARMERGDFSEEETNFALAFAFGCLAINDCACGKWRLDLALRRLALRAARRSSTLGLARMIAAIMTPLAWRSQQRRTLEADAFAVQLLGRARKDMFAAITYLSKLKSFEPRHAPDQEAAAEALGLLTINDRIRWIEQVIAADAPASRRHRRS